MRNYFVLTELEKALLTLSVAAPGRWNKSELYALASGGDYEATLSRPSIAPTASRWYNSKKAQQFLAVERAAQKERERIARERIEGEIRARLEAEAGGESAGLVDYSNPANIVKKLNALINSSKDNSEILDAMKLLLAKSAELATPESTNPSTRQQRFYMPMRCSSCPIKKSFKEEKQTK